jgi:hypothetical protein
MKPVNIPKGETPEKFVRHINQINSQYLKYFIYFQYLYYFTLFELFLVFLVFLSIIQYYMNFIKVKISFRFLSCLREIAELEIRPLSLRK